VQEGNFADGLELIDSQVLAEHAREAVVGRNPADAFVDDDMRRGLRSEVHAVIGALPPKGRQVYEERFGVTAAQLLEDAVKANDIAGMEAVMRRYYHTRAGYRAAYLVAAYHLDHDAPLEGALVFEEMRKLPDVAAQWEPMLSFKAAVSWLRAGMPERCRTTLLELKAAIPEGRLTLGGRVLSLFDRDENALAWLEQTIGPVALPAEMQVDDWSVFRGNGLRTPLPDPSAPCATITGTARRCCAATIQSARGTSRFSSGCPTCGASRRARGSFRFPPRIRWPSATWWCSAR
jgi:hypothetical protein